MDVHTNISQCQFEYDLDHSTEVLTKAWSGAAVINVILKLLDGVGGTQVGTGYWLGSLLDSQNQIHKKHFVKLNNLKVDAGQKTAQWNLFYSVTLNVITPTASVLVNIF